MQIDPKLSDSEYAKKMKEEHAYQIMLISLRKFGLKPEMNLPCLLKHQAA